MADKHTEAKKAYDSIVSFLDSMNWKYDKNDDDMTVMTGVSSNDIPIKLFYRVHEKNQLIQIYSHMPFSVPEDKRIEMGIAINVANYNFIDGSFDYNIKNGNILFRMTQSYIGMPLSNDVHDYMLHILTTTVDEYNDKFMKIADGSMTIEEFIQSDES